MVETLSLGSQAIPLPWPQGLALMGSPSHEPKRITETFAGNAGKMKLLFPSTLEPERR